MSHLLAQWGPPPRLLARPLPNLTAHVWTTVRCTIAPANLFCRASFHFRVWQRTEGFSREHNLLLSMFELSDILILFYQNNISWRSILATKLDISITIQSTTALNQNVATEDSTTNHPNQPNRYITDTATCCFPHRNKIGEMAQNKSNYEGSG